MKHSKRNHNKVGLKLFRACVSFDFSFILGYKGYPNEYNCRILIGLGRIKQFCRSCSHISSTFKFPYFMIFFYFTSRGEVSDYSEKINFLASYKLVGYVRN